MTPSTAAITAFALASSAGMGSCVEVEPERPRKVDHGPPPVFFTASSPKGRWAKCVARRERHLKARKQQRQARKRQRRCR